MDPRLKSLIQMLQDETMQIQVLAEELSNGRTDLNKNEADRVLADLTFQRLHREWVQKKQFCN